MKREPSPSATLSTADSVPGDRPTLAELHAQIAELRQHLKRKESEIALLSSQNANLRAVVCSGKCSNPHCPLLSQSKGNT